MDFEARMSDAVKRERQISQEIIELIRECMRTQHYLRQGFRSVQQWLIDRHKYSETAANRRIQAARLVAAVPEVAEKMRTGEVNLTTLSQLQSTIRREEIRTGTPLTAEAKQELIAKIEDKSEEQTQRLLADTYPDAASKAEFLKPINGVDSRFVAIFDAELLELIAKAKDLCNQTSTVEVFRQALKELVKRKDPARPRATRSATGPEADIPASLRREVLARGCEFENAGQRCGTHRDTQVDHIIPRAVGGTDDPENLRCLCRKHNLLAAELAFGERHMRRYRRDPMRV